MTAPDADRPLGHADPPAEEAAPRLAVEGVDVALGGTSILESVSMRAESGQFVGLIGPNGAGKTTLLRTINGVVTPTAGRVTVAGDDLHALDARAASRLVATVPQDTTLSFDFAVRDVVAMGRTPYRGRLGGGDPDGREAVEAAMARAQVTDLADRSIGSVSGGERQRVVLARALAQDAPLLCLDEPTASLDIHHQVRTLELVADLVADGRTAVAAIHDLNLAAHFCDELVLLGDGRVLATGEPVDVLTEERLQRAFDARAVVSTHPVTGATYVTALPERTQPSSRSGRVHVIGGGGTASRLLYLLSAAGFSVSTGVLNEGDADLETARLLGLETVTEEPFAPVGAEARARAESAVEAADVTVVADVEVGPGNEANLEAAGLADALVLVEERPFPERNFAGTSARETYRSLRDRATVVEPGNVLGAVEEALEVD